jgi:hypothetical protein
MTDTIEDLNHYYAGTVVGMPVGDGTFEPVNVLEFQGSSKNPSVVYSPPSHRHRTKTTEFVKKDWLLQFPYLGVFNVDDTVVYLQRQARRQWHKSYRSRLVSVHQLFDEELVELQRGFYNPDNPQLLKSVYHPEYFTFKDAYKLVDSYKHLAAAFSNEFYIGRKMWSDLPVLGFKNHFIGTVRDGVIHLKKPASHLSESLEEFAEVRVVK